MLQVPPWVHKETIECSENAESPEWTDRGTADGNSVQPDSDFGTLLLCLDTKIMPTIVYYTPK